MMARHRRISALQHYHQVTAARRPLAQGVAQVVVVVVSGGGGKPQRQLAPPPSMMLAEATAVAQRLAAETAAAVEAAHGSIERAVNSAEESATECVRGRRAVGPFR